MCLKVLGCHHALYTSSAHVEGFGMRVGGYFFPCFEKHDDLRTSAVHDQLEKKQHFESKFSNSKPSGESSFESREIAYAKKKGYRNEFASHFESDSSSLKIEVFSLGDSNSSDRHSEDDVRPVAAVLINVPANDGIELLAQVSDDDSMNIIFGSHGR